MAQVYVTRRALLDIEAIDEYSKERWGDRVALRYLADLYAAMKRFEEAPKLLQHRSEYSLRLRFYRVREHLLVCDLIGKDIYVLTVKHCSMDLPHRIAELEPQLVLEAQLLHTRLTNND